MRSWNLLATLVALSLVITACSDRANTIAGPSLNSLQPLDSAKLAELRKYDEGGCAISADSHGVLHGIAIPRRMLPFAVKPVVRDAKTGLTNARQVTMTATREDGTIVTLN